MTGQPACPEWPVPAVSAAVRRARHSHSSRPGAIHQYVFPGGQIPSIPAIRASLRQHTGLRVTADYPMGEHYARTLAEWRRGFTAAADQVSALGFGKQFQRMWNLYLAYCEGGFRAGYLDVHQLVLERRGW